MSCGMASGAACVGSGARCPVSARDGRERGNLAVRLPPVAPQVRRVRSGGAPGSATVRARSRSNGWCSSPRLEKHVPQNAQDAITWPVSELHPRVVPGQTVRKYGFEFTWTSVHRTGAQLDPFRYVGDDLADRVLESVSIPAGSDSLEAIRAAASDSNHPCHAAARALLDQCTTDPSWLDRDSVARGQAMFVRYGFGSLAMLFFFSLVGGFGAPRINKVLTSTGYLNNKHTFKRLFETTQMITDCLEAGSLEPGAVGWRSCVRVRMLHAKVRQRLRKLSSWREDEWGVPINQEDMCATQLSFCFNVILGLKHMGVNVSKQESEDYLHMWRYMGHLLGVIPEMNPCTSFFTAKAFMESIFMHLVEPDETSIRLAHNSLRAISGQPPAFLPFDCNAQMSRMLLGDDMADLLKLPPHNWLYHFCHSAGFLVFVRLRSIVTRMPVIGPYMMASSLTGLKEIVRLGLGGHRTSFLMSHSPESVKDGLEQPPVTSEQHTGPPMSAALRRVLWLRRGLVWAVALLALAKLGVTVARRLLALLLTTRIGRAVHRALYTSRSVV